MASKKREGITNEEFIDLMKKLTKANQRKVLWYMRWIIFKGYFRRESIEKFINRYIDKVKLAWERFWLLRAQPPIQKEINALWEKAKKDYRLKVTPKGLELSEFLSVIRKDKNFDLLPKTRLQPWLYIFDQGILWLMLFNLAFYDGKKLSRKNTVVIEFLIGTACVQANAIRMLCVHGFDLPSKIILRSFIETLITCIIIIHDEDLRRKYKKAQKPRETWEFWSKHLREKKLIAKIKEIFAGYELSEEVIKELTDWVEDEFRFNSEAVHPSYVSTVFATRPLPLDGNVVHLGILGSPTVFSQRTLSTASRFLWFFSIIAIPLLITPQKGKKSPLLKLKKYEDTSILFAVSHSIFYELVQNHWGDKQENIRF